MKNQLLRKSLISGKARTTKFFAGLLLIAMPAFANAYTVSFGVTFGNPQSNDGVCVGKGVCKGESTPDAVIVTFSNNNSATTDPNNPANGNSNILTMSFSLNELMAKQPDKVASFNDPLGYSFDSPYLLNTPVFQSLNLLPGAMIPSNTRFATTIAGDVVTVYIPYVHADN